MSGSEVIFKVSEKALEMVKNGEAVYSSGGIRKKTGELIELAKPTILEKVEKKYVEIKPLIDNCKAIQLIDTMQNVQALSWANAAIGLVNCGLTFICYKKLSNNIKELNSSMIQSFNELNQNINRVISILHDVDSHISRLDSEQLIEQFRGFFANLEYDVSKLNSGSYDLKDNNLSRNITNLLNDVMSFLFKILERYESNELEDEVAITILYTLGMLFAKEVEIFEVQYYQTNKQEHPNFYRWREIISKIGNSEKVSRQTTNIVMKSSAYIDPVDKYNYARQLNSSFSDANLYLEAHNIVAVKLPYTEDYDKVFTDYIKKGLPLKFAIES